MATLMAYDLGRELCEALRIPFDDYYVTSVTLSIKPDDMVRVTIERIVSQDEATAILKIIKECYAVEYKDTKKKPVPPAFPADREDWHGSQSPIG